MFMEDSHSSISGVLHTKKNNVNCTWSYGFFHGHGWWGNNSPAGRCSICMYMIYVGFLLEGQSSGKQFAVNMFVDCLDGDCVSVQAGLGWWNNPGWVQQPCLHPVMYPLQEHSTRNSREVWPQARHAG